MVLVIRNSEAVGQRHAPAALPPRERVMVPIAQETRWAPGLVWRRKNLPTPGDRTPNRPYRSEWLSRPPVDCIETCS